MSCDEIREQLVETARARELSSDLRKIVFEHAAECGPCGHHLDNEQRLTHALGELAMSGEGAPARMEQMIRRRMKVVPLRPAKAAKWAWPSVAAAAAAAVIFIMSPQVHVPGTQRLVKPAAANVAEVNAQWQAEDSDGFTPLPYAAELGPEEQAEMVRVQMPRGALVAMGVPVNEADSDEQIQADVLVGMDGTARAIRAAN